MVSFLIFRFLYYEDGDVSSTTVIGTLYTAEKYAVTDLVNLCRSFLETNITEETVCDIMENARIFNMTDLLTKCVHFIYQSSSCARKVFESSGFLQCSRECLIPLVKADELPLREEVVYKSLIRWAKHNCNKEGNDVEDSTSIRTMLGNLIFHVRFPVMSLDTFWKDVAENDILSDTEKVQISRLISGKSVKVTDFNSNVRTISRIFRLLRGTTVASAYWSLSGLIDAIDFEVNESIFLHGLLLYGGIDVPYTYKVEVKLLLGTRIITHVTEQSVSESTPTFKIEFDKPCDITPNKRYTLWAKIVGPNSYSGSFSAWVKQEHYVFKFYQSDQSQN